MPTYGNQTLGRGELHFSRFVGASLVPSGYLYIGNTPSFNLTVNSTNLDHFSSERGVREKDKSIIVETNRMAKFDADDIQMENLAWFFLGSKATLTQTSAAAISETVVGVVQGLSYQLGVTNALPGGSKGIANVVVTVASTPKVAGTDYLVDLDRGIITVLEGGGIANAASITVVYDKLAKSYDQVVSGSQSVAGALQFRSYNPEGKSIDFLMPYVKLTPNGDFALKADNAWQSLPFNVEILTAPARAAIYANGAPY